MVENITTVQSRVNNECKNRFIVCQLFLKYLDENFTYNIYTSMAAKKKEKTVKTENDILPVKYQHLASVLTIFLSLVIFFHEIVFDGKTFVAADTVASKSFETFIKDAEQEQIAPLWNPYIFCGMPGVASLMVGGSRSYDISATVLGYSSKLFSILVHSPEVGWELFYYFLLGTGFYFFVYDKLKSKIAALFSGLAVMHSTFVIILIMVGHMTKVPVIAFFPWIFMITERLREKFSFAYLLVLIFLIHFMLLPGHIQMIFYVYLVLGFYYLFFFIYALIKKLEWKGILRSGIILAAATGIAFLMTGDQYFSTLEYSKYSMRGSNPIVPSQQAAEKGSANGGLDYDYATQWSFSPGETFTFLIPSLYGFGNTKYQGVLTQNQEIKINTYYGPQPFTDAPQYMGILVLVLAGIGFWKNRKDPFVIFLSVVILLSLLISYGKEFSLLFDLMFNYFPMFNKFRIPSMILILVQMLLPVLAGYGFVSLVNGVRSEQEQKQWMVAAGIFGALLVFSFIVKDFFISIYEGFFSKEPFVQRGYQDAVAAELFKFVSQKVASDISILFLLLAALCGGMYLYWKGKISFTILSAGVVLFMLFDLWRVNSQPMDAQPHHAASSYFAAPNFVKFLQQDTTLYRTLQFENGQPPYDNTLAYWRIESAYGYSGTKMRQVQDMYDVCGIGNPLLWSLMNVKYIISNQNDSSQMLLPVYRGDKNIFMNSMALPRTFFVDSYQVKSGIEILNSIKQMNFHPMQVGYFMEDPKITVEAPAAGAKAEITHYGIQDLEIQVHATGNNLLFLSEAWYPEGWKAFLDGNEIPIYRMNYMFRSVVVPAGDHSIVMKFEPKGFYFGKQLSLWINILSILGLGYFGFIYFSKRKQQSKA